PPLSVGDRRPRPKRQAPRCLPETDLLVPNPFRLARLARQIGEEAFVPVQRREELVGRRPGPHPDAIYLNPRRRLARHIEEAAPEDLFGAEADRRVPSIGVEIEEVPAQTVALGGGEQRDLEIALPVIADRRAPLPIETEPALHVGPAFRPDLRPGLDFPELRQPVRPDDDGHVGRYRLAIRV